MLAGYDRAWFPNVLNMKKVLLITIFSVNNNDIIKKIYIPVDHVILTSLV